MGWPSHSWTCLWIKKGFSRLVRGTVFRSVILYENACCSAEATHCHWAETGYQPWQASMLLKVSCHLNGCEGTCCSSSRCSAAECQHGWGVWWGNPEQLWHLLTATVFTPTVVASSGTCCSMLLCWGPPSFTVTLDAVPDHVEIQSVFIAAVEQHWSGCLVALCKLWTWFQSDEDSTRTHSYITLDGWWAASASVMGDVMLRGSRDFCVHLGLFWIVSGFKTRP